jgi:hypothetical protein
VIRHELGKEERVGERGFGGRHEIDMVEFAVARVIS